MDFSGCVTTEVRAGHSTDIYVSVLADTTEVDCIDNENNTGGYTSTDLSTFVERSPDIDAELISTRVSVPESDPTNIQVSTMVEFGQDCDGNCCYDVYMMDSYGDGWTGSELQVFEGFTPVATLTLDDGYGGWASFCIDSGLPYFFNYDNATQQYDDDESFVLIQGDANGGNTLCTSAADLSNGLVSECAPNNGGVMYCQ